LYLTTSGKSKSLLMFQIRLIFFYNWDQNPLAV
jgi:hypothetical protein